MSAEKKQNLQDTFLNSVRKSKTPLTIFLVNGVKLQGVITWFDNFSVLLRRDGHTQLVYKHAISTVMPGAPIMLLVNAASAGDILTVSSFSLTASGGVNVPARIILPSAALTGSIAGATADVNNTLGAGVAFLLPLTALSANTTYTVTFNGARDGKPLSKTWSFTTGAN